MMKEKYESLPLATLKDLAKARGLKGISTMKKAESDLNCLIRDLKTEQVTLQNTCETLLDGIAPDGIINSMIERPFGTEWNVYNNQVQLRLWRSSSVFKQHMEDMREAALELQRKLAIDGDGKVSS